MENNSVPPNGNIPNQASAAPDAPVEQKDPRFEAFERREKALQSQHKKQQEELRLEREQWQQKIKSYESDYVPKSRLKDDPLGLIQESGLSLDQLAEMLLNQPNQNDPTVKAMLNKISALEAKQAKAEADAQAAQTNSYANAIKQINTEVKLLVDSNPDYETIKAVGMEEAVTQLIESTYKDEGYLMDIETAARQIEDKLVEEAYKYAQLSKVQKRLQPAEVTPAQPQKQQGQPAPNTPGIKTLTNSMQTSSKSSEKDRIQRAIAAFNAGKVS